MNRDRIIRIEFKKRTTYLQNKILQNKISALSPSSPRQPFDVLAIPSSARSVECDERGWQRCPLRVSRHNKELVKSFGLQAGYGHVVLSSGDIDIFVVGEVTAARVALQLHVVNLELGDGSLLRFVNSVFWFPQFLENDVKV